MYGFMNVMHAHTYACSDELRLRFPDGVEDDWDAADFRQSTLGGGLRKKVPSTEPDPPAVHS